MVFWFTFFLNPHRVISTQMMINFLSKLNDFVKIDIFLVGKLL